MARNKKAHIKTPAGRWGGLLLVGMILGLIGSGYLVFAKGNTVTYSTAGADDVVVVALPEEVDRDTEVEDSDEQVALLDGKLREQYAATYLPTPEPLKAIYMSQCVVGTPTFREDLVKLIDETELNAVVIDVKDYSGGLGYPFKNETLAPFVSNECGAWDMPEFLAHLKEKKIYTIARITVFQDPNYARAYPHLAVQSVSRPGQPWKDHKGLNFIDVSAKPFWEYMVTLSKEVHKLGFDELNFDYVRFPSDGPMADAAFTHSQGMSKAEALEHFFVYLHEELTENAYYPEGVPEPVLSADLFGFTTSNTDDLSIGQVIERALPYFDYIAPMVYPSHYPHGSFGYGNPNEYPYEIIHRAMGDGVRRAEAETTVVDGFLHEKIMKEEIVTPASSTTPAVVREVFSGQYKKPVYDKLKLRPWLQDFDYGGDYDAEDVRAQIKATYDVGLTSWMLWAPSNRYTKAALIPASEPVALSEE